MAEEEKVGTEYTVTEEGHQKLLEELEFRKTVKRAENQEAIKVARSFGDLSENSEYDEAKLEQAKNESRIIELEEMLKNIKVVSKKDVKSGTAGIGTVVKVEDPEFGEISYTIVGSTEADPMNDMISDMSPIGKALVGSRSGDVVTVESPGGAYELKVISVRKRK